MKKGIAVKVYFFHIYSIALVLLKVKLVWGERAGCFFEKACACFPREPVQDWVGRLCGIGWATSAFRWLRIDARAINLINT